jgi:hypothetical protein
MFMLYIALFERCVAIKNIERPKHLPYLTSMDCACITQQCEGVHPGTIRSSNAASLVAVGICGCLRNNPNSNLVPCRRKGLAEKAL